MKDKHTATPWKIEEDIETKSKTVIRSDEQVWDVASTQNSTFKGDIVEIEANAERIVACVNALDGIPNDALSDGVVGEMVKELRYISNLIYSGHNRLISRRQIDAILSKLEADNG